MNLPPMQNFRNGPRSIFKTSRGGPNTTRTGKKGKGCRELSQTPGACCTRQFPRKNPPPPSPQSYSHPTNVSIDTRRQQWERHIPPGAVGESSSPGQLSDRFSLSLRKKDGLYNTTAWDQEEDNSIEEIDHQLQLHGRRVVEPRRGKFEGGKSINEDSPQRP